MHGSNKEALAAEDGVMMSQGKQHMPIGLKLDTAKVLEAANKGQHLRK